MFYQDKLIDGIWHFLSTPDGQWTPLTVSMLHEKIATMQKSHIREIREMERDAREEMRDAVAHERHAARSEHNGWDM